MLKQLNDLCYSVIPASPEVGPSVEKVVSIDRMKLYGTGGQPGSREPLPAGKKPTPQKEWRAGTTPMAGCPAGAHKEEEEAGEAVAVPAGERRMMTMTRMEMRGALSSGDLGQLAQAYRPAAGRGPGIPLRPGRRLGPRRLTRAHQLPPRLLRRRHRRLN